MRRAMVVYSVSRFLAFCLVIQQSVAHTFSDEGCTVEVGEDLVRRVTVPHDASYGYVVTSVAFIGQTMNTDSGYCDQQNASGRFDVMANGDIIVISDLSDLVNQNVIMLTVHSTLGVESWHDQLAIRVANGSNMVRFGQNSYEGHVYENMPPGSVVRNLENLMAHLEGSNPRSLRYALVDGPNELFVLHRTRDGTLRIFTRQPLDWESESQYLLTIAAVVHEGDQEPAFTKVWVIVDNINDNIPEMCSPLYEAKVQTSDKIGKEILAVRATDADGDHIEYNLIGGNKQFGVHKKNGSLHLLCPGSELNKQKYVMHVYAADQGERPSLSSTVRVFVTGNLMKNRSHGLSNRARREVRPTKQMEVPESMIGEVLDLDNTYYEIFALKEPAPKLLEIHPTTGTVRLRTGENFDYETQREINFTIVITRVDDSSCK